MTPEEYQAADEAYFTATGNHLPGGLAEEAPKPPADTITISVDDLDRIIAEKLAERDAAHQRELEEVLSRLPQLMVPAHGGGPGTDNHQRSWSLAEQELARSGVTLDSWK